MITNQMKASFILNQLKASRKYNQKVKHKNNKKRLVNLW